MQLFAQTLPLISSVPISETPGHACTGTMARVVGQAHLAYAADALIGVHTDEDRAAAASRAVWARGLWRGGAQAVSRGHSGAARP